MQVTVGGIKAIVVLVRVANKSRVLKAEKKVGAEMNEIQLETSGRETVGVFVR